MPPNSTDQYVDNINLLSYFILGDFMFTKNHLSTAIVAVCAFSAMSAQARDTISIVGSSTVYPFASKLLT